MRKQTAWLLIIMAGSFAMFLAVATGHDAPFQKLVAQVGMVVGVAPNPYNTLLSQLDQQQSQLNQQAADLAAREAAFASSTAETNAAAPMPWYLIVAVAAIGLLVLLNFYLDWRRSRRASAAASTAVPSKPEGSGQ